MTTPVSPQEIEAICGNRRTVLSPIGKHKNETVILASDFDTLLRAIAERDATIKFATQSAVDQAQQCLLLREALAWSIKCGAKDNLADGLRDSGCGCCSANIEPPAHLRAVLEAARNTK